MSRLALADAHRSASSSVADACRSANFSVASILRMSSRKASEEGQEYAKSLIYEHPCGVAVDINGQLFVADYATHCILTTILDGDGEVTTFAGGVGAGYIDGDGESARFRHPAGLAVDATGNLLVADQGNHRIRKVTPEGSVTTIAGGGSFGLFVDGQDTEARFHSPSSVAVERDGNVVVADQGNHRVRRISPRGYVTTIAGSGCPSFGDGQATAAHFNSPSSVAVDRNGNVVVADQDNHRIRRISPSGYVTTIAGSGNPSYGDGQATAADFRNPSSVAVDRDGNVIVADQGNHRLRKITLEPDHLVTTVAGNGEIGAADGQGHIARFNSPWGVAVSWEGSIFVTDWSARCIRKVLPAGLQPVYHPARVITLGGSGSSGRNDRTTREDFGASTVAEVASKHIPKTVQSTAYRFTPSFIRNSKNVARLTKPPWSHMVHVPPELPSIFTSQMMNLLSDPNLSDVTFQVEGVQLTAHWAVLTARSKYFASMLSTVESQEGGRRDQVIRIGDVTPGAFRALLQYLYTDEYLYSDEEVVHVMRKADETHIDRLYSATVRHCFSKISVQNATLWFIQADQFGLSELRALTLRFLARHFREVREHAKPSLLLLQENPELMMEVMLEAL